MGPLIFWQSGHLSLLLTVLLIFWLTALLISKKCVIWLGGLWANSPSNYLMIGSSIFLTHKLSGLRIFCLTDLLTNKLYDFLSCRPLIFWLTNLPVIWFCGPPDFLTNRPPDYLTLLSYLTVFFGSTNRAFDFLTNKPSKSITNRPSAFLTNRLPNFLTTRPPDFLTNRHYNFNFWLTALLIFHETGLLKYGPSG